LDNLQLNGICSDERMRADRSDQSDLNKAKLMKCIVGGL